MTVICTFSLPVEINVDVIHSDLSHSARTAAINRFRTGETWVLIATDLLGRGLDFLGLNTVVNYDFPQVGNRREWHPERRRLYPSNRENWTCGEKGEGNHAVHGGRQADAAVDCKRDEDQWM